MMLVPGGLEEFSVAEVIVLSDSDPDPVCEWCNEDLNVDNEAVTY